MEFDRSLNAQEFIESFQTKMIPHVEELITHLMEKEPPVLCILADNFFVSLDRVAKKFAIWGTRFPETMLFIKL